MKEGIVTSTTSSYSIRKDDGVEESHFGGFLYVPFGSVFCILRMKKMEKTKISLLWSREGFR